MQTDRCHAVCTILTEYLRSPSLRHVRDAHSVRKLAQEIVQSLDRTGSVWRKWNNAREQLARAAAPCWIPVEDLHDFLSSLPGPALTLTDVAQRLRAFWEEPWGSYPNENLRAGCRGLYDREKAQGTEMPAIIGAFEEYIEQEEARLAQKRDEDYRKFRDEEKARLRQRFTSGADCGWVQFDDSRQLFCRRNGRLFRIAQGKDKRWKLFRVSSVEDDGTQLGSYQGRREANRALEQIAYGPDLAPK
jgi:hypothetical protein